MWDAGYLRTKLIVNGVSIAFSLLPALARVVSRKNKQYQLHVAVAQK